MKVYKSLLKFNFYNPRSLNIIFVTVFLLSFACSVQAVYSAQVTLAWDASIDPNIDGYKIYYGTSSRNYDVSVDLGNFTSCTIADMEEGKTYNLNLINAKNEKGFLKFGENNKRGYGYVNKKQCQNPF